MYALNDNITDEDIDICFPPKSMAPFHDKKSDPNLWRPFQHRQDPNLKLLQFNKVYEDGDKWILEFTRSHIRDFGIHSWSYEDVGYIRMPGQSVRVCQSTKLHYTLNVYERHARACSCYFGWDPQ